MAPPKTRSRGGLIAEEERLAQPKDSVKVSNKSEKASTGKLPKVLDETADLRKQLEDMKTKYLEKKRLSKELKQTIEARERKIEEQENYIAKLRKDRKKAEQVHKHNVANFVTMSAQNQALMTVMTNQQQSAQHIFQPQVLQSLPFPQPFHSGMLVQPHQQAYPPAGFNYMQPGQQFPLLHIDPRQLQKYNESYTPPSYHS